eukprot:2668220-Pyramimonas_sp.AAC.1
MEGVRMQGGRALEQVAWAPKSLYTYKVDEEPYEKENAETGAVPDRSVPAPSKYLEPIACVSNPSKGRHLRARAKMDRSDGDPRPMGSQPTAG